MKHILPSNTSPLSAGLLPSSNYDSMLPTMACSLLISQTPVPRFLQHEYQDCYSFGRRRTTRFFFTKPAATSERASERHPVFSQVLDSILKERKKSVRNLPEGKRERRRATAAAVLISSRMAMREEIRSPRRERIDQQKRIEQAFTSGTPW